MSRIFDVRKFMDSDVHERIDQGEQLAMVEIVYLAMASDGDLASAEIELLGDTMATLRGESHIPADIIKTLTGLVDAHETASTPSPESVVERLKFLSAQLQGSAKRELAYMLVCAMTMADEKTEDAELEFDSNLIAALGLTPDRAEALLDKVVESQ